MTHIDVLIVNLEGYGKGGLGTLAYHIHETLLKASVSSVLIASGNPRNLPDVFVLEENDYAPVPQLVLKLPAKHRLVLGRNELADLSIGDGWRGTFSESNNEGNSVIIVRNPELSHILEQGQKEKRYKLTEITEFTAYRMHSNVFNNKKIGAFARMHLWQQMGRAIPSYSIQPRRASVIRFGMEFMNVMFLLLCRIKIARIIINSFPFFMMKPMMKFIRGGWRLWTSRKQII